MNFLGLLSNLVGGGIGGWLSGAALKEKSLGTIGNIIAGVVGGTIGSYILTGVGILKMFGIADMPIGSIAAQGGMSAVIGAIITSAISLIKTKMKK
jgi:uncharacterized membrane protein YeaQ/YmgE (transglycosylase-associated protein family)